MSEYQNVKAQMLDCYKANRVKLMVAVIVVQLLNGLLNYANVAVLNSKEGYLYGLWGILFFVLLLLNFILLFMFPAVLRDQMDLKHIIRYAISRFPIELGFTFLMTFVSMFLGSVTLMIFGSIPVLFAIVSFIISVGVLGVQSFFAYAIYDRCHGVFRILGESFAAFIRNWKLTFRAILPYIVFSMVISLAMQVLMGGQLNETLNSVEAMNKLFETGNMGVTYQLLGLYVINCIGSAILLTYVYLFYAQIYENNKSWFSIPKAEIVGTITIDVEE